MVIIETKSKTAIISDEMGVRQGGSVKGGGRTYDLSQQPPASGGGGGKSPKQIFEEAAAKAAGLQPVSYQDPSTGKGGAITEYSELRKYYDAEAVKNIKVDKKGGGGVSVFAPSVGVKGYVLSSGEFTTDKARADADIASIRDAQTQRTRESKVARFAPEGVREVVKRYSPQRPSELFPPLLARRIVSEEAGRLKTRTQNPLARFALTEFEERPLLSALSIAGFGMGVGTAAQAGRVALPRMLASKGARAAFIPVAAEAGKQAGKYSFLQGAGRIGAGGLVGLGSYVGTVEVGTGIGYFQTPKESRDAYFVPAAVVKKARAANEAAPFNFWENIAYGVAQPLGDITASGRQGKEAYKNTLKEYYAGQGLSGEKLDKAVAAGMRYREARGYGEVAGLVTSSAATEFFAQKEFAKLGLFSPVVRKTAPGLAKAVSWPSAKILGLAGFQEGAVQSVGSDYARGKDISLKKAAIYGGIGAVTAPLIGVPIIMTQITGKKGTKAVIQGFAYATDPYELPGDILAGVVEKGGRRLSGRPGVQSAILSNLAENAFAFTSVSTDTDTVPASKSKKFKAFKGLTPSPAFSFDFTAEPSGEKPSAPSSPFTDTPSDTKTPSDTRTTAQTTTPSNTFTDVLTNLNTQTATNTFVTSINVPVVTPQLRIPPPIPLTFGLGGGGGGGVGKGGKRYADELAAGFGLLSGLLKSEPVNPRKYVYGGNPLKKGKKAAKKAARRAGKAYKPRTLGNLMFGGRR